MGAAQNALVDLHVGDDADSTAGGEQFINKGNRLRLTGQRIATLVRVQQICHALCAPTATVLYSPAPKIGHQLVHVGVVPGTTRKFLF